MQDRYADRSTKFSCDARPDHTLGQLRGEGTLPLPIVRRGILLSGAALESRQSRRLGPPAVAADDRVREDDLIIPRTGEIRVQFAASADLLAATLLTLLLAGIRNVRVMMVWIMIRVPTSEGP